MQLFRKAHLFLFFVLSVQVLAANATDEGEVYLFHRPTHKNFTNETPKSVRSGDVVLVGGLKVPVYSLTMVSGGQDGLETFAPKTRNLSVKINPELANQLEAYAYPMGIILVPKNWSARSASVGADGSVYMIFAPDTSGQTYLSFSHAGACVGCAYMAGSLYFEEARNLAKKLGFPFYQESEIVRTVKLNQTENGYSIKITEGNPVDGLVSFDIADDYHFFDVQISAPADQHAMATAILNQFILPNKDK